MFPLQERLNRFLERLSALPPRAENRLIAAAAAMLGLLLLMLLVLPPQTYHGKFTNDILIFFDVADRVLQGQVPNRDFHAPLGPLAFLFPALGLWLGGSLGEMMPLATAAFALVLTPLLIYLCASRLPLLYALPSLLFILFLTISPLNISDPVDHTSFAMFYNRFCYAMLSLLFLLALPRKEGVGSAGLDVVAAAALLLLMFYTKASYALVGAVFVLGLALFPDTRRASAGAVVLSAAGVALVELLWGGTTSYFADMAMAAEASGSVRGSLFTLSRVVLEDFTGVLLFVFVLAIAFARGARWGILLLCLYMAGAGVLIVNQNALSSTILTLVPAAFVAALAPARAQPAQRARPRLASNLLLLALALPPTLLWAVTLGYFTAKSSRPPAPGPFAEQLDGMVVQEGQLVTLKPGLPAQRAAYGSGAIDLDLFNMVKQIPLRQPLSQPEYLGTIKDGITLLRNEPRLAGKTLVFDMASPFNAFLGREPPRGADAWHHAGRTFSETTHRPAERLLADIDVVLLPKAPMDLDTNQLMRRLYGPYLQRNFERVAASDYWLAYRRRPGSSKPEVLVRLAESPTL